MILRHLLACALVSLTTSATAQKAQVNDFSFAELRCLQAAMSPEESLAPDELVGVAFEDIAAPSAIQACEKAVAALDGSEGNLRRRLVHDALGRALHGTDARAALEAYQVSLNLGSWLAALNAGVIYFYGAEGVEANADLAERLFDRALASDKTTVYRVVGTNYASGSAVVPPAPERALDLLLTAAKRADVPAAMEAARLLRFGPEEIRNRDRAFQVYLLARQDPQALITAAAMLDVGEARAADEAQKLEVMKAAADAGSGAAALAYARLVFNAAHPEQEIEVWRAYFYARQAYNAFRTAPPDSRDGFPPYVGQAGRLMLSITESAGIDDPLYPRSYMRTRHDRSRATDLTVRFDCQDGRNFTYPVGFDSTTGMTAPLLWIPFMEQFHGCRLPYAQHRLLKGLTTAPELNVHANPNDRATYLRENFSQNGMPFSKAFRAEPQVASWPLPPLRTPRPRPTATFTALVPNMASPAMADIEMRNILAVVGRRASVNIQRDTLNLAQHVPASLPGEFYQLKAPPSPAEVALMQVRQMPIDAYASDITVGPLLFWGTVVDRVMNRLGLSAHASGPRWRYPDGMPFSVRLLVPPIGARRQEATLRELRKEAAGLNLPLLVMRTDSKNAYRRARTQGEWDVALDFEYSWARPTSRWSPRLHLASAARASREDLQALSADSDRNFSRSDYSGIDDPAVEAALTAMVNAEDSLDYIEARRALQRIVLWQFYVIPLWIDRLDSGGVALARSQGSELNRSILEARVNQLSLPICESWKATRGFLGINKQGRLAIASTVATRDILGRTIVDRDPETGLPRSKLNQNNLTFDIGLDGDGPRSVRLRLPMPTFVAGGKFSTDGPMPRSEVSLRIGGDPQEKYSAQYVSPSGTFDSDFTDQQFKALTETALQAGPNARLTASVVHSGNVLANYDLGLARHAGACLLFFTDATGKIYR